jgi:hypothetical protein
MADLHLRPAAFADQCPGSGEDAPAIVGEAGLDAVGFAVGHEELNIDSHCCETYFLSWISARDAARLAG